MHHTTSPNKFSHIKFRFEDLCKLLNESKDE